MDFDSSNDTAEQFRERAARLRELGYHNAADECDAAADELEGGDVECDHPGHYAAPMTTVFPRVSL